MSNIAVLTLAIGENFRKKVYYAHLSKIEYCKKYGYDFIEDESVLDTTRPIAWSKILLIKKYLHLYDYVVWIDADAMIMDLEQKIEDKLPLMGDKQIMVINLDGIINTGVIFIKNDIKSALYMDNIYTQTEFINHGNWEQTAFIHVYENNIENLRECVEIKGGEFEKHIQSDLRNYVPGNFILHLAGWRQDYLSWTFNKVFERFYPLKREDENEEHYTDRMNWIKNRSVESIKEFYLTSPYAIIEK